MSLTGFNLARRRALEKEKVAKAEKKVEVEVVNDNTSCEATEKDNKVTSAKRTGKNKKVSE
jgi:hypothetical protein